MVQVWAGRRPDHLRGAIWKLVGAVFLRDVRRVARRAILLVHIVRRPGAAESGLAVCLVHVIHYEYVAGGRHPCAPRDEVRVANAVAARAEAHHVRAAPLPSAVGAYNVIWLELALLGVLVDPDAEVLVPSFYLAQAEFLFARPPHVPRVKFVLSVHLFEPLPAQRSAVCRITGLDTPRFGRSKALHFQYVFEYSVGGGPWGPRCVGYSAEGEVVAALDRCLTLATPSASAARPLPFSPLNAPAAPPPLFLMRATTSRAPLGVTPHHCLVSSACTFLYPSFFPPLPSPLAHFAMASRVPAVYAGRDGFFGHLQPRLGRASRCPWGPVAPQSP